MIYFKKAQWIKVRFSTTCSKHGPGNPGLGLIRFLVFRLDFGLKLNIPDNPLR